MPYFRLALFSIQSIFDLYRVNKEPHVGIYVNYNGYLTFFVLCILTVMRRLIHIGRLQGNLARSLFLFCNEMS